MTDCENVISQIGEYVFMEMKDVKQLTYDKNGEGEFTKFVIMFDDGKKFTVEIKATAE